MAWLIDAATVPSPPNGAPPPAITVNIQRKNQAMLPSATAQHRDGLERTTAAAAVIASTGSVSTANGSSSAPGSTALDSPRTSCRASAVTASTAAIDARTIRLLRNLPARYPVLRSGVAARIWPTPVCWSRAIALRTT